MVCSDILSLGQINGNETTMTEQERFIAENRERVALGRLAEIAGMQKLDLGYKRRQNQQLAWTGTSQLTLTFSGRSRLNWCSEVDGRRESRVATPLIADPFHSLKTKFTTPFPSQVCAGDWAIL